MQPTETQPHKRSSPKRIPRLELPLSVLGLLRNQITGLERISARHGDLVTLPVPGRNVYLAISAESTRHVLFKNQKNYRRSFDFKLLMELLGESLITTHDEVWRSLRKPVQPTFHREKMPDFFGPLLACTQEAMDRWAQESRASEQAVDIGDRLGELTLSALTRLLFSVDVRQDYPVISRALLVAQRELVRRMSSPVDLDRWLPTPGRRRFDQAVAELGEVAHRLIRGRREQPGAEADLLTAFFQARDSRTGELFSDEQVRDQLLTLFIAGHETSALALTWALLLLAEAPQELAQVRAEIDSLQGPLTAADLPRLKRVRAVMLESMRLYPPAWSLGREAIEADVLDGVPIEAGATVMLCPYLTHRHTRYWERPASFEPARFLRDDEPQAFVPFGGGARRCVGEHFAMMELIVILAEFLRRFDYEVVARSEGRPPRLEPLITLRPKDPVRLLLRARH